MDCISVSVKSSVFFLLKYEPRKRELRIHFKDSQIFSFTNVPQDVFKALADAKSKGKYFRENIKNNPAYPFKRIEQ